MSRNSDPKAQHQKKIARAMADKVNQRTATEQYEVGYGKHPASARFVKGQSGNPHGRPRKPKPRPLELSDALSTWFLEKEAYRPIALRENGQAIELSATQAVLRSLIASAIKGNRLAQKYFLEYVATQEELAFHRKLERYAVLEALKREGEKRLAEHKRGKLPPPVLVPHPDDIVLHPWRAEAYVIGPESPEHLHFYEHSAQMRDHILLRSAHSCDLGKWTFPTAENECSCGFLLCAQFLDRILPPRYRWRDKADLSLFMGYRSLTRRERERRIATEIVHLNTTRPRLSLVTPEREWEISRIVSKIKRGQNAHPDGAIAG